MNRALAGAVFVFLLARAAGPQAAAPNLSRTERADRTALLPDDDRRWLEFVEPILLDSERNFFLLLTEPHQREIFRGEFWKRREKPNLLPPLGLGYRHRYEELLRAANEEYDGWREDAGRMVLAHGEPASLEVVQGCNQVFRHLEIWTYSNTDRGYRSVRSYFFYRTAPLMPRKLWTILDPESEVFDPGSCRKRFEDLYLDCVRRATDPCPPNGECACHVYQIYKEIQSRQSSRIAANLERAQVLALPSVPAEDLADLAARFPGIADPRAKLIAVESEKTRPAAATAPPEPTPSRVLNHEEIRERITELPPKYRQWLDLAAPLMTTGDLVRFLLMTNAERDRFIREFFKRRRGPGV